MIDKAVQHATGALDLGIVGAVELEGDAFERSEQTVEYEWVELAAIERAHRLVEDPHDFAPHPLAARGEQRVAPHRELDQLEVRRPTLEDVYLGLVDEEPLE